MEQEFWLRSLFWKAKGNIGIGDKIRRKAKSTAKIDDYTWKRCRSRVMANGYEEVVYRRDYVRSKSLRESSKEVNEGSEIENVGATLY